MLLVVQFKKCPVFSVSGTEGMWTVVRGIHLRLTEFFIQVALGELYGIHGFQFELKIIFHDRSSSEVYNFLRQIY